MKKWVRRFVCICVLHTALSLLRPLLYSLELKSLQSDELLILVFSHIRQKREKRKKETSFLRQRYEFDVGFL